MHFKLFAHKVVKELELHWGKMRIHFAIAEMYYQVFSILYSKAPLVKLELM